MAVPTPNPMSRWDYLGTRTASASASVAFAKIPSDLTVAALVLVCRALVPSANTVTLNVQVSTGGAIDGGGNYAFGNEGALFATGILADQGHSAATTAFLLGAVSGTAGAAFGTSATIFFPSPFDTTSNKSASWQAVQALTAVTGVTYFGGGIWNNTAALDGFSIAFSSGNISTGAVDLYRLVAQ